jgi:catechol 2,3-dioxygenase-like lactoylglutathione lyase family enzyme
MALPPLNVLSVKIPVSDLSVSRPWYAQVFGLREEMEWPDADGVVRGVAFAGLGQVTLALREHSEAAAATDGFGFVNVLVPHENDLPACAAHLDALTIAHTPVISGARGRLIGFHDPDGHELSFYAETHPEGVRADAVRGVRPVSSAAADTAPPRAPASDAATAEATQ